MEAVPIVPCVTTMEFVKQMRIALVVRAIALLDQVQLAVTGYVKPLTEKIVSAVLLTVTESKTETQITATVAVMAMAKTRLIARIAAALHKAIPVAALQQHRIAVVT